MGTEILRPQDCLVERIRISPHASVFPRRRSYNYGNNNNNNAANAHVYNYNFNPRPNRKPAVRSERQDQRKRFGSTITTTTTSQSEVPVVSSTTTKVTILRRGESLDSKIKSSNNSSDGEGGLVVTGADRLGPDPEMVKKQIRIVDLRSPVAGGKCDVYAGSAFAVSPEPSSLPLPSFSKKKQISFDDSATRDLRRLLRLDL